MNDARKWTEDETTRAIGMFRAKISARVIAEKLDRTEASVRRKLKAMGIYSTLTRSTGQKKGASWKQRASPGDVDDFLGSPRRG